LKPSGAGQQLAAQMPLIRREANGVGNLSGMKTRPEKAVRLVCVGHVQKRK
jgi:hypothetical protein